MNFKLISVIIFSFSITACNFGGPKQTGGTYIGAASGALVGSQFGKGNGRLAMVAIGTLLGAGIGNNIGSSMDERDKVLAASSTYNALERQPDNKVVAWNNPNNNHSGSTVATNTVQNDTKVCRDYTQTVVIDGKQETINGRACRDLRDARGQWYASSS